VNDIRDLLGEGERGSITVFPDGLPADWFKFLGDSPPFVKRLSPEHAMELSAMLATDAFLTIEIWANEAWRQRELRRELAAALRDIHDELFRYKQLAEQHIDEAEWDTDYERAMREVVEAALREELNPWTNAVAEALRDRAEKAEQALAAAREETAKLRWQRDYVIDIAEEYGGCDFTSEDVLSLDDLWTARKETE